MTAFIDAHVHPPVEAFLEGALSGHRDSLRAVSAAPLDAVTIEVLADMYRSRNAKGVLLGWDSEWSQRTFGSADIAALVAAAPDVFKGFGALDPLGGAAAVAAVHETSRLGLSGLSFHPAAQRTAPNDRGAYPVWEVAAEHDLICLMHTGYTRLGAGERGGGGVQLDVARPTHVDTIAADFPSLRIVMAHTGRLWFDEALAVASHKDNIWLDLSGQGPASFSEDLVSAITGPLQNRVVFGTDYPFAWLPDDWLREWDKLAMPAGVTDAVLRDNAAALLDW